MKIYNIAYIIILHNIAFIIQGGSRPHVIFAKNEVRISIFDDGSQGKDLPTGFSADVEGKFLKRVNPIH